VKFYRAFNCIYSRVKAPNSELVMVQLLKSVLLTISFICIWSNSSIL